MELQQSAMLLHFAPSGAHVPLPQTPFVQRPEQQSEDALQSLPSSAQGALQTPLSHSPLQQSPSAEHDVPMGVHFSTHAPFSQRPLQQSLASLQGAFFGMQSHEPLAHKPWQQSLDSLHFEPKTPHSTPQNPATQEPVQHSEPAVHTVPSLPQAGAPQVPSVQTFVQQSFASAHASPSDLHVGAAQCPSLHSVLQQSDADSQSIPKDLHEAESVAASLGPASAVAPSKRSPRAPQPATTDTRKRAAQSFTVRSTRAAYSITPRRWSLWCSSARSTRRRRWMEADNGSPQALGRLTAGGARASDERSGRSMRRAPPRPATS
jgi:hypothetical protein